MSAIAVLLALLCVLCYTGQNFFNKLFSITYNGPPASATPVFACVYGLITGFVTLAYSGFQFRPSAVTLALGVVNGVILFLFNLSAINASRTGPYAFQSIMMLFGNILLPLFFTVLVWGDRLNGIRIAGILVMLGSFVLFNGKGLNFAGVRKGYFLWVFLLFLTNGLYGIVLDAQQRLMLQTQRNEMIVATFAVSAIISAVYLLILQGRDSAAAFRMGGKTWAFVLGSSICAAAAVNTLMLTMTYVPVSVLYTISNGGVLIANAVLGAAVLKEKLNGFMIAGIGLAVFSLILLSV